MRALIREGVSARPCTTSPTAACWWRVAEMALAGGIGAGAVRRSTATLPAHAVWFGEDQGRYLLAVAPDAAEEAVLRARRPAVAAGTHRGAAGGEALSLPGEDGAAARRLRAAHEAWLPEFMGGK